MTVTEDGIESLTLEDVIDIEVMKPGSKPPLTPGGSGPGPPTTPRRGSTGPPKTPVKQKKSNGGISSLFSSGSRNGSTVNLNKTETSQQNGGVGNKKKLFSFSSKSKSNSNASSSNNDKNNEANNASVSNGIGNRVRR